MKKNMRKGINVHRKTSCK